MTISGGQVGNLPHLAKIAPCGRGSVGLARLSGAHECSFARRAANDGNENAGLSGRGEKIGDRPLRPLATEWDAFAPGLWRLGTERSVPNFSQALLFYGSPELPASGPEDPGGYQGVGYGVGGDGFSDSASAELGQCEDGSGDGSG